MAGMYPECGWNGPGVDLEWPGIWWEWTWNGPGMDLEWPGIWWEWTWNVAKIIILFFTWIPPGMTWNDLEWIKIWVWIIKLFLLGMRLEFTWIPTKFLPFHSDPPGSAWIRVECPGQGKVLHSSYGLLPYVLFVGRWSIFLLSSTSFVYQRLMNWYP